MAQIGTTTLDEWLGDALPGRLHLLLGGPGAGKTSACLHFINTGLQRGERAALLTHDRPGDLRAHAVHLGIELRASVAQDRLMLVRYRTGFGERAASAASPQTIGGDLRRMLGADAPRRVAIDTVSPFLGDGIGTGAALAALIDTLESAGATTVVTWNGELGTGIDRRLDPLLERAAVILRFRRETGSTFRVEVARARHAIAVGPAQTFEVLPGAGIRRLKPAVSPDARSPAVETLAATETPVAARDSRRLLLLHEEKSPSKELLALLGQSYEVATQRTASDLPDVASPGVAAVVVETTPAWIPDVTAIVRRRASVPQSPAIVVCARFNLRSADRACLLRAGADEVVATDMSPPELRARLAAAIGRGHLQRPLPPEAERILTQHAAAGDRLAALDGETFARALAAHLADDPLAHHTIATVTPLPEAGGGESAAAPTPGELDELADAAMRCMRVTTGDLVAVTEGRVLVYLHGARHDDAAPLVERLRARWSRRTSGSNHLRVDLQSHPSGRPHPPVKKRVSRS